MITRSSWERWDNTAGLANSSVVKRWLLLFRMTSMMLTKPALQLATNFCVYPNVNDERTVQSAQNVKKQNKNVIFQDNSSGCYMMNISPECAKRQFSNSPQSWRNVCSLTSSAPATGVHDQSSRHCSWSASFYRWVASNSCAVEPYRHAYCRLTTTL